MMRFDFICSPPGEVPVATSAGTPQGRGSGASVVPLLEIAAL